MAKRGQIEIIGGGFYEPIYAIIPDRDKINQMKKLSKLIKLEFGLDVKGAWLSERVWEPNYPSFLDKVGLKYVIVDDNHFRSTGITQEDTLYSYITEDSGKTVRIFPINEELRYLTPWKPTYKSIDYLKSVADKNGDRMALLISDAEKLGVWGSTHEFCYIEGKGHYEGDNGKPFVSAFFEQITNNNFINSLTLSEYMDKYPAKSLVYLPTATYDKMEEWVLPTDIRIIFKNQRSKLRKDKANQDLYLFLKGGFWRHFLVKYPESNNMHKKMIYVREKLIQVENKVRKVSDKTLHEKFERKIELAWEEIFKSQCNDPYWHGLFGGVYIQFLRFSIYSSLINAENIIDEINSLLFPKLDSYVSIIPIDFNKDSKMDLIVESNNLNVYISPSAGGTIFELDYKPKSYNLLNVLTRWKEAYHEIEKIEENEISIDRFRRSLLRIRFIHEDISLEKLAADNYYEFSDFMNGDYEISKNEKSNNKAIIILSKEGYLKDIESDEKIICKLTKELTIQDNKIITTITGTLLNDPNKKEILQSLVKHLNIGIDIPFFFNGDPKEFKWESKQVDSSTVESNSIIDNYVFLGNHFKAYDKSYDFSFEINIDSDLESKIAKFPLITNTFTDEGYQNIFQGINVIAMFKIRENFKITLELIIN
ncbi:MAG: DUF1925 domain-containing protein [Candidatus Lokiarchaeota archaeon]|nr:DUF1925 domain-containing protein [Candidatus Lokiarchaeota archaeon]